MTASDDGRFSDKTLLGVFASFVAAFAIYGIGLLLTGNETVASVFAASAAGVPAAVEYRVQARRRDPNVDAARLAEGHLRRPIAPILVMFVAAVFLIDSVIGAVVGAFYGVMASMGIDVGFGAIVIWLMVITVFSVLSAFAAGLCANYLGAHPYRWVTVGVVLAAVIRVAMLIVVTGLNAVQFTIDVTVVLSGVIGYVACLAVCLLGVKIGLRYRDKVIALELRRVQRKQATARPPSPRQPYTLLPPPNPRDRRLE